MTFQQPTSPTVTSSAFGPDEFPPLGSWESVSRLAPGGGDRFRRTNQNHDESCPMNRGIMLAADLDTICKLGEDEALTVLQPDQQVLQNRRLVATGGCYASSLRPVWAILAKFTGSGQAAGQTKETLDVPPTKEVVLCLEQVANEARVLCDVQQALLKCPYLLKNPDSFGVGRSRASAAIVASQALADQFAAASAALQRNKTTDFDAASQIFRELGNRMQQVLRTSGATNVEARNPLLRANLGTTSRSTPTTTSVKTEHID